MCVISVEQGEQVVNLVKCFEHGDGFTRFVVFYVFYSLNLISHGMLTCYFSWLVGCFFVEMLTNLDYDMASTYKKGRQYPLGPYCTSPTVIMGGKSVRASHWRK